MPFIYVFTLIYFIALGAYAKADVKVGLSSNIQYFEYEEFNSKNESLNREKGFIPGLEASFFYLNDVLSHRFSSSMHAANINYDGQTQTGSPHQTETSTTLYRLSYELDVPLNGTQTSFFTQLNWDHWSRSIQATSSVSGLDEVYQWPSMNLGFKYNFILRKKHVFSWDISYIKIFEGSFEVDLNQIGFGKEQLDLGAGNGFDSSFAYEFRANNEFSLGINFHHRTWTFEKSSDKTISNNTRTITFSEPKSRSKRTTLSFELIYSL